MVKRRKERSEREREEISFFSPPSQPRPRKREKKKTHQPPPRHPHKPKKPKPKPKLQGLCDNLLTSVVRAWDWEAKPLLIAPAMNTAMWTSPLTGKHLEFLKSLGAGVVPPIAKALACGDVGMGAMAEPEEVAVAVKGALGLA